MSHMTIIKLYNIWRTLCAPSNNIHVISADMVINMLIEYTYMRQFERVWFCDPLFVVCASGIAPYMIGI